MENFTLVSKTAQGWYYAALLHTFLNVGNFIVDIVYEGRVEILT